MNEILKGQSKNRSKYNNTKASNKYMLNVNKRNATTVCETCSKLKKKKTPKKHRNYYFQYIAFSGKDNFEAKPMFFH